MKKLFAALFVSTAGVVYAQTCIVPAPVKAPTPTALVVRLPADGGTVGCTVRAFVSGGAVEAGDYPISNAKCAQSVAIAKQAAANDNGWNDGGVP